MTGPCLEGAVARFARELPGGQVETAAQVVESTDIGSRVTLAARLAATVPNPRYRARAAELAAAWSRAPGVDGSALALALRAAAAATAAERARQRIDVVWTGPAEVGTAVRQTEGVLVEVVEAARHRLTLVSFAAHRTRTVTAALRRVAGAGVEVRLVLDGGTDAELAFTSLGDAVSLYTWPPTLLPPHDAGHASLHAKAALADDQVVFVTSANLTGHAMNRNMELGLLVTGGDVPRRLAEHFDALVATATLVPWTPSRATP